MLIESRDDNNGVSFDEVGSWTRRRQRKAPPVNLSDWQANRLAILRRALEIQGNAEKAVLDKIPLVSMLVGRLLPRRLSADTALILARKIAYSVSMDLIRATEVAPKSQIRPYEDLSYKMEIDSVSGEKKHFIDSLGQKEVEKALEVSRRSWLKNQVN
ncbi:MAG: hypothetical protein M1142_04020 [Patescibacteria group bacterium]|nr:hypothetical protein [Patescibacteria group bacterium]